MIVQQVCKIKCRESFCKDEKASDGSSLCAEWKKSWWVQEERRENNELWSCELVLIYTHPDSSCSRGFRPPSFCSYHPTLQVTTGELWKLASMVLSRRGLENIRIYDLAIQ
jgi:hypothetical protein